MKRFRSKIIAICIMMLLSITGPINISTGSEQFPVQNVVHVDAKKKIAKKKSYKKSNKKSVTVYVTATGECYHRYACGRGTYYKSTLKSAKASGLRACKKCY